MQNRQNRKGNRKGGNRKDRKGDRLLFVKQTKVIVPVVASWDVSGRKQIRIEGFETVEIIGMEGDAIRAKVIGSAEETLYTYDNNGNLIGTEDSKGKTVLEYDYENRLTKLTKPDGTWTRFTYDPFGRRYSKETSDGQKEIYIYDGLHIIEVYDGNTMQLKSSFVHSDVIDEALFGSIQGQDVYYHQDGLNSVKALTDGGGNEMARYDYDAWGNLTTTLPSIANPFTYTGREWDKETGLYYYRARYYDAKVGRFVTKDPIGFAGGINQFVYVGNNPVNFIDPWGLQSSDPDKGQWGPLTNALWDFWKNYSNMRKANTIGADQYFHCMANCQAAKEGPVGKGVAEIISEGRELFDEYIKGDPRSACDKDRAANRRGREGDLTKPCKQVCAPLRPRGLDPKY